MSITAVALLAVGLAIGFVLGWLLHAGRSGTELAVARAEADAAHANHDLLVRSLSAASEDAARRQSGAIGQQVSHIVTPLRETLDTLAGELRRTERNRIAAYAGLSEQVSGMRETSAHLGSQAEQLAGALRSPQARGRWGELHLERVIEAAGLQRHCDFTSQVSGTTNDSSKVRPDLVVHLAGGRDVVIDAKVPLSAYLDASDSTDPTVRAQAYRAHARALRGHVLQLSSKAYWEALRQSPEFVVLFVPGEAILEMACRADPDLIEYGFTHNVVIATPTNLVALLRTIALGWRHEALTRDAQQIHQLGKELYQRIGVVTRHLDKLGGSLGKAVESYNSAIGTIDSRVTVTARKLSELDAFSDLDDLDPPVAIDVAPRRTESRVN
ncbi:DNA recombination protein RmuC [Gordonia rubripertincta]|uniref:DNA recombination protein RmuC n=1 Tax=Gordonia rubripertincta TaxID=36822 RepID=A0ABT4MN85_GORRU|nr:DNA recombination protein RmuC [Gordonia rubripertincta]MCZ4548462.1 DNA recombination protein RmuC [Gordonia rubripertincta]